MGDACTSRPCRVPGESAGQATNGLLEHLMALPQLPTMPICVPFRRVGPSNCLVCQNQMAHMPLI